MKVITVGRNQSNDVVISDPKVSRHHLQIILDDSGNYKLTDFGSKNSTFVNNNRISGEVYLNPNDIIRIGNTTLPWKNYFSSGYTKNTISTPQSHASSSTPNIPPKTWLLESILVTIFCCWPFGIASIVNAAKVEKLYKLGDIAGAQRASDQALKWLRIGFIIGIIVFAISFIVSFFTGYLEELYY